MNIYEVVDFFFRQKIQTTARHYVDKLAEMLENDDHIYKGEDDGESIESLVDATIGSKLGDKIFDSSVTIVLISKGTKNIFLLESDQWIPWEISYSLKEQSRQGQRSKTNGVIEVVLPDENGRCDYYITYDPICNCRRLNTSSLLKILRDNMFNTKAPQRNLCNGLWVYSGDCSYIESIKWVDFINGIGAHIDKAIELRNRKDEFTLIKNVK